MPRVCSVFRARGLLHRLLGSPHRRPRQFGAVHDPYPARGYQDIDQPIRLALNGDDVVAGGLEATAQVPTGVGIDDAAREG